MIKATFFFQGTNSTGGKEDIVPRICAKPDTLYYPIKQMQAVTVRFASNRRDEFSGAIAGYASYKKGMFFFTVEHNLAIEQIYLKPFRASGHNYLIIFIDWN